MYGVVHALLGEISVCLLPARCDLGTAATVPFAQKNGSVCSRAKPGMHDLLGTRPTNRGCSLALRARVSRKLYLHMGEHVEASV